MIQVETVLDVADNSGAKKIKCIKILGGSKKRYARVGDLIIASVKSALPNGSIKKKNIVKAVIVRTRNQINREDGTFLNFSINSAVIVDDNNNPKGTRIFWSCCQGIEG